LFANNYVASECFIKLINNMLINEVVPVLFNQKDKMVWSIQIAKKKNKKTCKHIKKLLKVFIYNHGDNHHIILRLYSSEYSLQW
jgi:hypothetical protein